MLKCFNRNVGILVVVENNIFELASASATNWSQMG